MLFLGHGLQATIVCLFPALALAKMVNNFQLLTEDANGDWGFFRDFRETCLATLGLIP